MNAEKFSKKKKWSSLRFVPCMRYTNYAPGWWYTEVMALSNFTSTIIAQFGLETTVSSGHDLNGWKMQALQLFNANGVA
jgi:hypothetical protein